MTDTITVLFAMPVFLNPLDHSLVINNPTGILSPVRQGMIMPYRYQVSRKSFYSLHDRFHFIPGAFKVSFIVTFKSQLHKANREYKELRSAVGLEVKPVKWTAGSCPECRIIVKTH